jgi:hypothetical protein
MGFVDLFSPLPLYLRFDENRARLRDVATGREVSIEPVLAVKTVKGTTTAISSSRARIRGS